MLTRHVTLPLYVTLTLYVTLNLTPTLNAAGGDDGALRPNLTVHYGLAPHLHIHHRLMGYCVSIALRL